MDMSGSKTSKPSARIFSSSFVPPFLKRPSATTFQAEGLAFLIQSGRYIGDLPRRYAAMWGEGGGVGPPCPAA